MVNTHLLYDLINRIYSNVNTPGSIPFVDSSGNLVQNNQAFYWDEDNTRLKLYDKDYTPFLTPTTSFLTIGSDSEITIPAANNFWGTESFFTLGLTGTSKLAGGYFTRIELPFGGAPASPTIMGNWVSVASNGFAPSGTSRVYAVRGDVDVGFPVSEAYGGSFQAVHGSSAAEGAGKIVGVRSIVGIGHNGDLDNGIGVEVAVSSSASSPQSFTDLVQGVKIHGTMQSGITVNDLRGLSIDSWVQNGADVLASYGIYLDASMDLAIDPEDRYAIYSLSTALSRFVGDIEVATNTAGIILRSPDNSRWRIAVSDGGVLSAAAA